MLLKLLTYLLPLGCNACTQHEMTAIPRAQALGGADYSVTLFYRRIEAFFSANLLLRNRHPCEKQTDHNTGDDSCHIAECRPAVRASPSRVSLEWLCIPSLRRVKHCLHKAINFAMRGAVHTRGFSQSLRCARLSVVVEHPSAALASCDPSCGLHSCFQLAAYW